mmetsp:Transcript_3737/g.11635  ORF Transcript_3737/g.11635 Transcript_3737/m.11635 type:complete len:373 (-) Transcript_3737:1169-2287(-)
MRMRTRMCSCSPSAFGRPILAFWRTAGTARSRGSWLRSCAAPRRPLRRTRSACARLARKWTISAPTCWRSSRCSWCTRRSTPGARRRSRCARVGTSGRWRWKACSCRKARRRGSATTSRSLSGSASERPSTRATCPAGGRPASGRVCVRWPASSSSPCASAARRFSRTLSSGRQFARWCLACRARRRRTACSAPPGGLWWWCLPCGGPRPVVTPSRTRWCWGCATPTVCPSHARTPTPLAGRTAGWRSGKTGPRPSRATWPSFATRVVSRLARGRAGWASSACARRWLAAPLEGATCCASWISWRRARGSCAPPSPAATMRASRSSCPAATPRRCSSTWGWRRTRRRLRARRRCGSAAACRTAFATSASGRR